MVYSALFIPTIYYTYELHYIISDSSKTNQKLAKNGSSHTFDWWTSGPFKMSINSPPIIDPAHIALDRPTDIYYNKLKKY